MRLKTWHCLALLTLAVLLAYYPSLYAGINSVDDQKMIDKIEASGPLDPVRIFVRGSSYYYRPLTILTYTLDRDLWGAASSFMHLHNILLHLACALLVYAITRRLLPLWGVREQWPALFAGLFFALHPIATESVAWISGRTDVLMSVFLLLAVWLILIGLATNRGSAFLAAAVALFAAPLAKEVAVFVLPGLLWLIVVHPGSGRWFERARRRWWALVTMTGAVAGYFIVRALAIGRDRGVSTALKGITGGADGLWLAELLDKGRVALKVYGFYFKKLFVPWPLNFAIVEISDWYVLCGAVLLAVLLYLVWRADVQGALGLMAFCVLSPALLVIFGQMTWTPLAERYLYASAALFAPLAAWLAGRAGRASRWRGCALALVLLVFFGSTVHRAWIWQDNLRLYRDTVAKSPDFPPAKAELASALVRRGQEAEGRALLTDLQASSLAPEYINDDLNLAAVYLAQGDGETAVEILLPLLENKTKKRFDILQALIRTNDWRLGQVADPAAQQEIHRQNLAWLVEQQQLRPGPFVLYRIGKRYLTLGDKAQALEYLQLASVQAPEDSHYRAAAKKLADKLHNELQ